MTEPDQLIKKLEELANAPVDHVDSSNESDQAALAIWRVPETRTKLISSKRFSEEAIERLDNLAKATIDMKAEATARDAADRFQSGVRFDSNDSTDETLQ